MVTKRKRNNKKPLILSLALLVIVVAALITYGLVHNNNKTVPTSSNSQSTKTPSTNTSTSTYGGAAPQAISTSSPNVTTPPPGPAFNVTITRATQATINGSNELQVLTIVSGVTQGSCQLTVTKSGAQTAIASSQVVQQVNAYGCQSLTIPSSEFQSSGTWNVLVTVTSDGTQESAQTTVNITT